MLSKSRCAWAGTDPLMILYHDTEWGRVVRDDQKLFEFLVLESAQAGLSWRTILHRREGYRQAFANFDVKAVSKFGKREAGSLAKDVSIIRNRAKIEATINNAQRFLEIQKEFGSFYKYSMQFLGERDGDKFAKDLKKRGFKFLGPTTVYAHMQACGMVDDHEVECFRKKKRRVI